METNHKNLQNALRQLREYEPEERIWEGMRQKMNDAPLQAALAQMPEYEPDERLWTLINRRPVHRRFGWGYAAAAMIVISAGLLLGKIKTGLPVSYTEEQVDVRLQTDTHLVTDEQYQKLKTYCETETLVCNSQDYRYLQQEYERLSSASEALQQAIGSFNTEPELMRQFNDVEQQKTLILNKMAKMI
nr:hypothetical protein [uncultured Dyadobacter sp.]